MVIYIHQ